MTSQSYTPSTVAKDAILTCPKMWSVTHSPIYWGVKSSSSIVGRQLLRLENHMHWRWSPEDRNQGQRTQEFQLLPYFFLTKIFTPHTASCSRSIKDAHKQHDSQEKLNYEHWFKYVEHSTFIPLVFACTGGAGPPGSRVMSRPALKISEKGNDSYSDATSFIRTKISFAILRSSVLRLGVCHAPKR